MSVELRQLLFQYRNGLRVMGFQLMFISFILCLPVVIMEGFHAFMRQTFREEGALKRPFMRFFVIVFAVMGVGVQQIGEKLFFLGSIKSLVLAVFLVNSSILIIRIFAKKNSQLVYGQQVPKALSKGLDAKWMLHRKKKKKLPSQRKKVCLPRIIKQYRSHFNVLGPNINRLLPQQPKALVVIFKRNG